MLGPLNTWQPRVIRTRFAASPTTSWIAIFLRRSSTKHLIAVFSILSSSGRAYLVAQWMKVGFIHGVMNTDNTSVVGETIDYGPCAFMDGYDPNAVFSSIDERGRYSYSNQPVIAQWNLARFAETLLPLFDGDQRQAIALATESINAFSDKFHQEWLAAMRSKLGLLQAQQEDGELIKALLGVMHDTQADFTVTFRGLADYIEANPVRPAVELALHGHADFQAWLGRWRYRGGQESESLAIRADTMRRVEPQVHTAKPPDRGGYSGSHGRGPCSFEIFLNVIVHPFDEQPGSAAYAIPPRPEQRVLETFCGT